MASADNDTSPAMTTQTTEVTVSKPSTKADNMDKTSTIAPGDTDTTMKEPSLSSPTANDTKPTPPSAPSDNSASRPEKRRLANNGEDTRRNKRMMGMILGTLAQSKRATPLPSTAATAAGTALEAGVQGGMTSREVIQARVREKLEREKKLYQEQEAQERAEREKLRAERNEKQRQRQREMQQSRRATLDEVSRGVARGRLPTTRDTRPAPRWTGTDYILTETKPRLRYLPKVLSAVAKEKLEAQTRERAIDRERERGRILDRAPVDPRKDAMEKKEEEEEGEKEKDSKTESETTTTKTTEETGTETRKEKSESKGDGKLETMDLDSDLVVDEQKSPDEKEKKEEGESTETSMSSSESRAPVSEAKDGKDDEDVDMEPKKDGPPELINISLV